MILRVESVVITVSLFTCYPLYPHVWRSVLLGCLGQRRVEGALNGKANTGREYMTRNYMFLVLDYYFAM